MLTRDDLAALATSVYGSEWQTPLARDRGIAMRTMQRWAKEGIGKPSTAVAIRAYLLSRRVIDLPPPLSDDDEQRDEGAHLVGAAILADIVGAGKAVGWHEAEILAAMVSAAIDRMIVGAGAPATVETLREAVCQVEARVDR